MNNLTEKICEKVTIPDVLQRYGYPLSNRKRIPCPIHDGKDKNFCYTDEVYHCWSCGAKGNVVGLVMELFNLSFKSAVMKLNTDFSLGLGAPQSKKDKANENDNKLIRAAYERLEEEKAQYYRSLADFHRVLFKYTLNNPEDTYAEEVRQNLEKWLEDNNGEVVQPWQI